MEPRPAVSKTSVNEGGEVHGRGQFDLSVRRVVGVFLLDETTHVTVLYAAGQLRVLFRAVLRT